MDSSREKRFSCGFALAAAAGFVVGTMSSQSVAADYNFGIIQAVVNPYYATWPQAWKGASADGFVFGTLASQSVAADYNFGIIQAVVNPYYATWPQAAKDAAADFGIKVEIGSPQDFDQVQQDAVVNSFIAKGIKGIGIQPVDAVAGAETVKRVVAAGVPVIGVAACAELKGTGALMCINNALGE